MVKIKHCIKNFSSIGPVLSCVVEQTWTCEKEKRETIERQWNDLYPVAMTTCMMGTHKESPKMSCDAMNPKVKWSCDMPQALMCITSLQSKMMKGDDDLCRLVRTDIIEVKLIFRILLTF